MATWIRQGTGTAPTSFDAELLGDYALDNATAPADFDPAAVSSVQCQWTITGSGFVDDSWDNVAGVAVETGVTEISQHPGNGGTSLQNESSASDHTDSTGIPTGLTVAEWEAAIVRGDGTTVPDEWCLWNKVKGPDGSTLTVSLLTVTITYTPAAAGTTVTPATINTVSAVPTPTTTGEGRATPAVVPTTSAVPAPTPQGAAVVSPATVPSSSALPTPAVDGGGGGGGTITIVGTVQSGSAIDGGDVTLTFDGTLAEGDVVFVAGGNADNDGAGNIGPSTAGYTQRALRHVSAEPFSGGVWTKPMGATPDATVVCQGSGDAAEGTSYHSIVLRGVDPTTLLDVAVVETATTVGNDPDLDGLTTVTDGAWVVLVVITGFCSATSAYPTGYSNGAFAQGADSRRSSVAIATKEVATAGAEDPGAFTWSVGDSNGWFGFTVAIRPESAGGGTTVTPAVIPTISTVPTPTPTGAAKATPAVIATTSALPSATPQGEALTQPAAVPTTSAVPTPGTSIGKTVTPDTITTVASIPTPTPLGEALVTVSVINTTSALPTPTPAVGVNVTPDTIASISTIPTPTPQGGAAVSPAVILTTVTIPTPTVSVPSGATVTPATINTVSALSAPTPIGGAIVTPALIETLTNILIPLVGLPALDIIAPDYVQFQRIGDNLVLSYTRGGRRRGYHPDEGFERVSNVFVVDDRPESAATRLRAMVSVASAWAAHSGSSAATLKAEINQALQTAGFRRRDGSSLV